MKKREFDKLLRECACNPRNPRSRLDKARVAALPADTKAEVVRLLVRAHRAPILVEFLGPETDMDWLRCCAYDSVSTNRAGFKFLHTQEKPPGGM